MDFDPNLLDKSVLANLRDNSRTKEAILDAIGRRNSTEDEGGSNWEIYRDTIRAAYKAAMPMETQDHPQLIEQDMKEAQGAIPESQDYEYNKLYESTEEEVGYKMSDG